MLFGNSHLLRVAAAISYSDGIVTSGALESELAIGQTAVHRVLKIFEGVGLLVRLERAGRTAPQLYRRVDHTFWCSASELHEVAEVEGAAI